MSSQQNGQPVANGSDATEDDGSVFEIKNGSKHHFLEGEPIYPCNNSETFVTNVSKYCKMNTVQSLWLESGQLIKPEHIATALWIVSREVPHLQFCLMRRKDNFWLRRMNRLDIDFETSSKDPLELHSEMLDASFDLWRGPLWKVRVNVLISDSKIKSTNKYSAFLTLCVHHVITDATANMKICRELISILNKLAAGENVVPTYAPLAPSMNGLTLGMKTNAFVLKTACRKLYSSIIKNFNHKSSFNGAIPLPRTKSTKASFLFQDLSQSETETVLKMCRAAKITVNSFLITAANISLLTVAQSQSKIPIGTRKIVSVQAVNMRRYYEGSYKDSSGCHTCYIEDEFRMGLSDAKEFWPMAKKIHMNIKERIEVDQEPIKSICLVPLSFKIVPINSFLTSKGYENRTLCHYFTTNMGNLKDLLPGPKEGDDIGITYLLRSAGGSLCGSPFILACQTFREKMSISIDYSANTLTDESARKFMDNLFQLIRKILISNIHS